MMARFSDDDFSQAWQSTAFLSSPGSRSLKNSSPASSSLFFFFLFRVSADRQGPEEDAGMVRDLATLRLVWRNHSRKDRV